MKKKIILALFLLLPPSSIAVELTISRPGTFVLGNDLVIVPVGADTCIQINASNVTLDLNQHIITQGNLVANCNGITVAPNLTNVTIRNGTIANFTGTGITIGSGCNLIAVELISTLSCDTRGIESLGTPSAPNQGILIINSTVAGCSRGASATAAVSIQNTLDSNFENINLVLNGSTNHNLDGFQLINCNTLRLGNVYAESCIGSTRVNGFNSINTEGVVFFQCVATTNESFATTSTAVGFNVADNGDSDSLIFYQCISFGNTATATGSNAIGFYIGPTNLDMRFNDCIARDNIANNEGTGFYMNSSGQMVVTACSSSRNQSIGNGGGAARGYYLNGSSTVSLIDNVAVTQLSTSGVAVGIDLLNSNECTSESCSCLRNQGSTDANSFGFRIQPTGSPPAGNNVFVQNISSRNGLAAPLTANQYGGFPANQINVQAGENINNISQPWTNAGFT